ncbi:MAG: hypothetical protein CTY20_00775 [Hyphomicrobium sp.]|nr:MAG: hypothetical protein CTY20_00775 [Hyphomicrobium sp.]
MDDEIADDKTPFKHTAFGGAYAGYGPQIGAQETTFSDRIGDTLYGWGIPREQASKRGGVAGFLPDMAFRSGQTVAGEHGPAWAAAEAASYTPAGVAAKAVAPFSKAIFLGLPAAARGGIEGARLTLPGGQQVVEAASGLKPASGTWGDFVKRLTESRPIDPSQPTHRGLRLQDLIQAATVSKAYPDALALPVEVAKFDTVPRAVNYRTAAGAPPKLMVDPERLGTMSDDAIREDMLAALQARVADVAGPREGFMTPLGSPSRHAIYSQLAGNADVLEEAARLRQQGKSADEIVAMFGPKTLSAGGREYTPNQMRHQIAVADRRQQALRHYLDTYGHNRLMAEAGRMRGAGVPATTKEVGIARKRGDVPAETRGSSVTPDIHRSVMADRDEIAARSQMALYDWGAAREVRPDTAVPPFTADDYLPLF